MSALIKNSYFSRIAGLMLIILSFAGIWKGLHNGYSPTKLLLVIIIPYISAIILGSFLTIGKKWVQLPIVLMSLFGLALNTFETMQGPNKKDILEIIVFSIVLIAVTSDFAKIRKSERRSKQLMRTLVD